MTCENLTDFGRKTHGGTLGLSLLFSTEKFANTQSTFMFSEPKSISPGISIEPENVKSIPEQKQVEYATTKSEEQVIPKVSVLQETPAGKRSFNIRIFNYCPYM